MKLLTTFSFIALGLIAACSPSPSTDQYEMVHKSDRNVTRIEIHWMHSTAEVDSFCSSLKDMGTGNHYGACARGKPNDPLSCEIYMVQPMNFDDHKPLETLGHEAWHCLGAVHK